MVFLGATKEEQSQKQKILVTIEYELETDNAEEFDEMEDTIDYLEIYELVRTFPGEKKYNLLEHLYKELEEGISDNFDMLENLHIEIEKFPFLEGSVIVSRE